MNLHKSALGALALMSALFLSGLLSGCASNPAPRGIAGSTVPPAPALAAGQSQPGLST
jgi:hypothetical protein